MKYAAYGLLAAFLALGVHGAIPTTAEGWYTPSGGDFKTRGSEGQVYWFDEYGVLEFASVEIDENGDLVDGAISELLTEESPAHPAYLAMREALKAETIARQNTERIEAIGKNLHDLTSKDGIHIRNENTGQEFTIKFGGSIATAVSGTAGDIPATSDAEDPADKKSLDWTNEGKLEMKGWTGQDASGDFWSSYSDPVGIPVRTANGAAMAYRNWYGVDRLSLMPDATSHKLELTGWSTAGSGTMTPLAEAIKKSTKGTFDNYDLVVRNSSKGLNYVSLGTLDIGVETDDATITTNTTDGTMSLYGWETADESAESTSPYIPYADGSGHLAWQGILDFFNTGLFDLTESGKVNLKGVSASEDDLRVMTVSAGDSGAAITSSSISGMIDTPLDMASQKITVSGWGEAHPGASSTLAELLTGGTGHVNNPAQSPSLLTRTTSGGVAYMAIGTLGGGAPGPDGKSIVTNDGTTAIFGYKDAEPGMVAYKTANGLEWKVPDGAAVDGVSITTNTAHGATETGVASLRGFNDQEDFAVPYKHDGKLAWRTPDEWLGDSLEWSEVGGSSKLNVAGATTYSGNHSKHYFGTSNDKTATLGWHELPNVSTNRVEGDGKTIGTTFEQDAGGEVKKFGLLGWNPDWGGDPLFVVNMGGGIGYIPLPALTNLAACACTNKWNAMLDWIEDGELDDENGINFTNSTLDNYLYGTLGYIYSTTADNLHFDNDGENIQASFTAPENWADGDSVELTEDGAYQIKGFADASACSASMSAMLSDPTGSDATTHLLLAKNTDSDELHYVPIGDGITSGAEVDNVTITTNASGVASIYGWSGAANDTYLSKNEGGNLEWRKVDAVSGVDGKSIITNADAQLTLNGYAEASDGSVPVKQNNSIVWSSNAFGIQAGSGISITSSNSAQVVSHNFVAGAGISITPASSGTAVTIASATPTSGTVVDPHAQELTFLTELWYDASSHQIKAKRITAKVMFVGTVPEAETFTVVNCTPHSAEHEADSE